MKMGSRRGQAIGALVWGVLAGLSGLVATLLVASVTMLAGAATILRWPLLDVRGMNRDPAVYWAEPDLTVEPGPRDGPILVSVEYPVPAERAAAFIDAMQAVGRSRMRTGATRWGLFRPGETPVDDLVSGRLQRRREHGSDLASGAEERNPH